MAKNNNMTWKDIQNFLSECDLEEQIRLAEIKGVEVPAEVLATLQAQSALKDIRVEYGSKRFPDRVYMTFGKGSPVGGSTKTGSPRVGGAPYLTLQTLDAEIERLTVARDALRQAGFPTKPGDAPVPGPEAAKAAGFAVKDNRVG